MEIFENIKSIIIGYIDASAELLLKAGPMDGFLGMGNDPRKNSIHEDCYNRLDKAVKDAASSGISEEEAYAAAEFIIKAEKELACCDMAKAMLTAFQGLVKPLIAFLSAEHKAELLKWMTAQYPRWGRLPVQKDIMKLLG